MPLIPTQRKHGFTHLEMIGTVAVLMLLLSLLLPGLQRTRESARRIQCANNLRQQGVALVCYHDLHNCLPSGCVNDTGPIDSTSTKDYHMGWVAQILPYIERDDVYRSIDFNLSAHDPANQTAHVLLRPLKCPSAWARSTGPISSYAMCHNDIETPIDTDNNGVFYLNSSTKIEDLSDGLSVTLFGGEQRQSVGWMAGTNMTLKNMGAGLNNAIPRAGPNPIPLTANPLGSFVGSFSSSHGMGLNMLMGDGSVRFVNYSMDTQTLQRLANREDGQATSGF